MRNMILSFFLIACCPVARADVWVWDESRSQFVKEQQVPVQKWHQWDVVLLGEIHYDPQVVRWERDLALSWRQWKVVHLALEFWSWDQTPELQAWQRGEISDQKLIEVTQWGTLSQFQIYRPLYALWQFSNSLLLGINAPRFLVKRLAQVGLENLDMRHRQWLPPEFTLGSSRMRQGWEKELARNHPGLSPTQLERFFQVQSLWDDTMAWQICLIHEKHKLSGILAVVGEFHVRYRWGVWERLHHRCPGIKVGVIRVAPEDPSVALIDDEGYPLADVLVFP